MDNYLVSLLTSLIFVSMTINMVQSRVKLAVNDLEEINTTPPMPFKKKKMGKVKTTKGLGKLQVEN